jgi:hypothetical protein
MPYICKETVKTIAKQIKTNFPSYKWSITGGNTSSLEIRLMESDMDLTFEDSVSYYHPQSTKNESLRAIGIKVIDIVNSINPITIVHEDSDYGSIPNFYFHGVKVGAWNKPYKRVGNY